MISDFFTYSLRNMKNRKLRSFLTMIGIVIAIATIFLLISLSLGLRGAIQDQFQQLGTDKFFIQPKGQLAGPGTGGAVELTKVDVDVVEKVAGVEEVTYFVMTSAKVEDKKTQKFAFVAGIPLETSELYFDSFSLDLEEGKTFDENSDGIIVGAQYKHNNYLGKEINLNDKIEINDHEFKVQGILETAGNPQDDRTIYMSEDNFRALFPIENRIDFMIVQAGETENITNVAEKTEKKLRSARDVTKDTQDFVILTPDELLASFGAILNIITGFLLGVAAISLVVGGIGIANTMYTSVIERTKEIGLMKSVGAKNSAIATIFLIESGLLGLVGGLLGVLLGIGVGKLIEYIAVTQLGATILQVSTPTWLIFACLSFAFLAGAISGFLPSWNASNIKPTTALRYE